MSTHGKPYPDFRGLPRNVSPQIDNEHRIYFIDHDTKHSSWDDPRQDAPPDLIDLWLIQDWEHWLLEQVRQAYEELNSDSQCEENLKPVDPSRA